MITLKVRDRADADHAIETSADGTLMEAIRDAGIADDFALCGGNCSCATCHVVIDPAFMQKLDAASSDEEELLEGSSERQKSSRLSCQVALTGELDGMQLHIAQAD